LRRTSDHGNDALRVRCWLFDDINGCYQRALGGAIRSVNLATLTQIYLTAHTLRQAAVRGIEVPSQLTAR
jgi:hypothetical protein